MQFSDQLWKGSMSDEYSVCHRATEDSTEVLSDCLVEVLLKLKKDTVTADFFLLLLKVKL